MQKDSAADIELNLKKKARRRLVGAIALVILMMIVLPILLEDRSAVVSHEDVKISIQDGHKVITEPELEPEPEPEPEATVNEFDSAVVSAEENLDLVTTDKSKSNQESKLVEIEADPEASPPRKPAQPTPTKLPQTTVKTNSTERYYVQIGVYSDINNVKQLQSKLSTLGYKSNVETIGTPKGEKIRLRSQAFSSRNEAANALQNIKASGLTGMVVSQ